MAMRLSEDVIFKRWPGGGIIAVFPARAAGAGASSLCASFEHIGQHGAADVGRMARLRPASSEEYAELRQELESPPYNYRLRAVRKFTQAHQRQREREVQRWGRP